MTKQNISDYDSTFKKIEDIFDSIDSQKNETKRKSLGGEALSMIEEILTNNPKDIDALCFRMKLNTNYVFENTSKIIEDAEFIIDNFKGTDKNIGYEWLAWVYKEMLGLPDKAHELYEEQLMHIYGSVKNKAQQDKLAAEILLKLGNHQYRQNLPEKGLKLYWQSYEKDPNLDDRNLFMANQYLDRKQWDKAYETGTNIFFSDNIGHQQLIELGKKLERLYV